jgi:hypothetical protein
MAPAAEIMVRENKSFKEAVTDLGIPLNTNDCVIYARRNSFKALLRAATAKFHNEIGTDPSLTKDSVAGQLKILADRLMEKGDDDKSAQVLERLAKVKNWIGEGGNVNIFSGLTQRDIDEMKAKIVTSRDGTSAKPN